MRLNGKIAVVVGGGQQPVETTGNGRATCLRFAEEGATVLVVDQNLAAAEETVAMIKGKGGSASSLLADITREPHEPRGLCRDRPQQSPSTRPKASRPASRQSGRCCATAADLLTTSDYGE